MSKIPSKKPARVLLTPHHKRVLLTFSLALLFTFVSAYYLWQAFVVPQNQLRFEENIATNIEQQQQKVTSYLAQIQRQLTTLVSSVPTPKLYAEEDEVAQWIEQQQAQWLSSLPNAEQVQLFMYGDAQQKKDRGDNISFVVLSMVNRLEAGEEVYPEVAKDTQTKQWVLHTVSAIKDPTKAEQPVAILHVVFSLQGLNAVITNEDAEVAAIELRQRIARQASLLFFSRGVRGVYDQKVANIDNSYWQLSYKPNDQLFTQSKQTPFWVVGVIAAIACLLIAGAWFLAQFLSKKSTEGYADFSLNQTDMAQDNKASSDAEVESGNINQLDIAEEDKSLVAGDTQPESDMSEVTLPDNIFRAYDIRGIAYEELSTELAFAIGKAAASEALVQGDDTMIAGYDARSHSPEIFEHAVRGILSTGCDIINIGLVPTPLMNFSVCQNESTSSGLIVTASHNPKEYNGFKIVVRGQTLVEEDIQNLKQRIIKGDYIAGAEDSIADEDFAQRMAKVDMAENYIETIVSDIAVSDFHVVIDAGNGATSELAPKLFDELGCQVTPLFCEFDGEFPNHDPDPSVQENLASLIDKVQTEKADMGIAFDGDGDRLMVVAPEGDIVWPDQLLMLFAQDVVSRNPGCDIIFDVKSTRHLNQIISGYGGRPLMWKTGHSHIKTKMQETDALLAGEFSGHIFFKERWFGFDDGMYAACLLYTSPSPRDRG